jgi:endonuclease YncB( thermonuclease family)
MSTPNLLVIRGHVDVRTVWPNGASDADTLRLFVDPSTTWATFRKNGVVRRVRGLERAVVHGSVVRPVLSPTKAITIRLQGIDAPELHYRAPAPPRSDVHEEPRHAPTYRQPFGEMSSAALHDLLASFGEFIEVEATTPVDAIGDAFDTYGRLVGDVFVIADGQRINVNDWLLVRGWAFPTFYTSMSGEEIRHLTKLAQRARAAERGVWARYTSAALPPDPRRVYRGKHAVMRDELGLVCLPKLFRRRVGWREANLTTGRLNSFHAYLQQRDDQVVLRRDFLAAQRAGTLIETRPLLDFMNGKELVVPPWDLVFSERSAELRFR